MGNELISGMGWFGVSIPLTKHPLTSQLLIYFLDFEFKNYVPMELMKWDCKVTSSGVVGLSDRRYGHEREKMIGSSHHAFT